MGRGREEDRRQGPRQGAGRGRRAHRRRRAAGDARLDPRADADPRLPHPRPLPRQSRSARPRAAQKDDEELDPRAYGFGEADLDRKIFLDKVLGLEFATMREIVAILRAHLLPDASASSSCTSRCRAEGLAAGAHRRRRQGDHLHAAKASARSSTSWSRPKASRNSATSSSPAPSASASTAAKSLIPALEQIIKRGGNLGVKEIVLGMPHRGRLNVLTQVMGKPHRALFHEFKGGSAAPDDVEGSGDVKYHLGASSDREFDGNKVHLSLTAEPLASRNRRSGGARQGARQAGPARRDAGRPHHGAAAADAWRCGVRRPGRGGRMLRRCRA